MPTKQATDRSLGLCDRVLQYRTLQSEPKEHRTVQLIRGGILFGDQRWDEAASAYRAAVAATELLFASAATPQSRLTTLTVVRGIEERLVYCEAKNGRLKEAAVAAELARARSLADHLELDLAPTERLRPQNQQEFERLRNRIIQLETEARVPEDVPGKLPYTTIAHELSETYGALATLIEEIQQYCPEFLLAFDLDRLIDIAEVSPLVYLLATDAGGLALLVDRDGSIRPVWLPFLTLKSVFDYYTPWTEAFAPENESVSDRTDVIDTTISWLWATAMGSVCEEAMTAGEIVLIPFGLLGLLPLHAAYEPGPNSGGGRRHALDCVRIIYAPSARARGAGLQISKQTERTAVLAIGNPQPSSQPKLPFAEAEVKAILPFFANSKELRHKEATREIVLPKLGSFSVIHFACHGTASSADPLSSGLVLANDEILSLRDLLNSRLPRVRIAILSACNTAVLHVRIPEEVISLPTGLLQAGAAAVIGSLWPVSDISTMLLMVRFYAAWRRDGMSAPESLRHAQRWLRNSSGKEQLEFLESLSIPAKQMKSLRASLLHDPSSRTFEHPIYWAGFVYVGA